LIGANGEAAAAAQNTLECGGSAAAFEIATAATEGSSAKRLGGAIGLRRRDPDTAAWMAAMDENFALSG
jgi:hypothetical protein